MSIYSRISEIFDVKDLLQTKNPIKKELGITKVELDKGKGSGSIQLHITEENRGKQRVLLFSQDKSGKDFGHFRYNNRTYQNDNGDIVQFIANRLESKRLNDAIKLLNKHNYRTNASKWKENKDFEIVSKKNRQSGSKPLDIEKFDNLRTINELILNEEKHYLQKRNVSNDVLLDPKFIDRVMVYDNTVNTSNGPVTFTNTFFPKFDDNNTIVGAEIKTGAKTNNNLCLGIDCMLWNSNKPETVDKVALFESAIDAISHYQMDPSGNKNTWYFSTNGNFYETRQNWLWEKIESSGLNKNDYTLVLAMDRDLDGFIYDLAVYNKVLQDQYPNAGQEQQAFFSIGNDNGRPSIDFHTHHPKLTQEVNEWFFNLQDHFNAIYINSNENHHINIKSSNDRISLVFPSKSKLEDAGKRISASLARNIPALNKSNVRTHKASYLGKPVEDWNAALSISAKQAPKNQINGLKNKKSSI
ncbi:MAG: hypothetical protein AAF348_10935 [Bacteroidota bacterium]